MANLVKRTLVTLVRPTPEIPASPLEPILMIVMSVAFMVGMLSRTGFVWSLLCFPAGWLMGWGASSLALFRRAARESEKQEQR